MADQHKNNFYKLTWFIWGIICILSCSSQRAELIKEPGAESVQRTIPEEAKKELAGMGIQYNDATFFEKIRSSHSQAVKLFLLAGMNSNAKNEIGETPLIVAAALGSDEIVGILLENGAQVNDKDKRQSATALHAATMRGKVSTVRILLQKGADINAKGHDDLTPLMVAALAVNVELVKLLIDSGADLESKDKTHGVTALHIAALKGNLNMTKILLDKGANPNAKSNDGRTPLDLARAKKQKNLEELLLRGK
jgi:ankyrin repeat protein